MEEDLGRHRGREGKSECALCGAEYESVVLMCCESVQPIESFASGALRYVNFDKLNIEKEYYVGSELWEYIYSA